MTTTPQPTSPLPAHSVQITLVRGQELGHAILTEEAGSPPTTFTGTRIQLRRLMELLADEAQAAGRTTLPNGGRASTAHELAEGLWISPTPDGFNLAQRFPSQSQTLTRYGGGPASPPTVAPILLPARWWVVSYRPGTAGLVITRQWLMIEVGRPVAGRIPSVAPWPFGNVHSHGPVCWGTQAVPTVDAPRVLDSRFFTSAFNTDLQQPNSPEWWGMRDLHTPCVLAQGGQPVNVAILGTQGPQTIILPAVPRPEAPSQPTPPAPTPTPNPE